MSHTIDKNISTNFPKCKPPCSSADSYKFMTNTMKQTGPFDHFLLNGDFINVMQELHSINAFCDKVPSVTSIPETNFNFSCAALSVLPVAPLDNKNNGLVTTSTTASVPTQSNDIPSSSDADCAINIYLDSAFPSYNSASAIADTFVPCISTFTHYDKYPTFNTSYRSITKQAVSYKSARPDWEPYDWFFAQIH